MTPAKTISVALLAEAATAELSLVKANDGNVWRYDGAGRYLPDGLAEAEQFALDQLGAERRSAHVHELRTLITAGRETMDLSAGNCPDYLNTRSGLYEWATGTLHPHTSAHFYTYQLPHYLRPDATCPRIDAFLLRALPDEGERTLFWQWLGYCLVPGNKYKRALMIEGRKDAGKTVAIHIMKHLLGGANVSAVSLQDISDHRFAVAELVGKLANIADDLSDTAIKASGKFKAITGNGPVMCEVKGGKPFFHVLEAKLVFTANDLPGTGDMSDAYFGRWHILSFRNVIPAKEQDTGIWNAVTAPEEMEGALVKAIAAAHSLAASGFAVPESVASAVQDYREDADSVVAWLNEDTSADGPDDFTSRREAYSAFIRFAEAEHRGVMKAPSFYKRLRHAGVPEMPRNGVRGFRIRVSSATTSTANPLH